MVSYAHEHPSHVVFYKPGELVLFLEPKAAGQAPRLSTETLEKELGSVGVRLRRGQSQGQQYQSESEGLQVRRGDRRRDLFDLELESAPADPLRPTRDSIADVKTAFEHLNTRILQGDYRTESGELALDLGNYSLLAASPNWLIHPMWGCGSPSDRPMPASAPKRFVAADFQRELDDIVGEPARLPNDGVSIAIFDTWPYEGADGLDKIRQAALALTEPTAKARLTAFTNNGIVRVVHNTVAQQPPIAYAAFLKPDGSYMPRFDVSDHGLFVADIINDLVPEVEISVYRVLDDLGTGTLITLATAIEHAVQNRNRGSKLILNMSLGFAPVPAALDLYLRMPADFFDKPDTWGYLRQRVLASSRQRRNEIDALGSLVMKPIRDIINFVDEPDVLAVAAAGNDAGDCREVGPRFPANLETVLGVSSVDPPNYAGQVVRSDFSNLDDLVMPDDGISAQGREITGIHRGYGWATWSGTSFATPVASAMAACVWTNFPPTALLAVPGARDVMTQIVKAPRVYLDTFQS